MGAVEWLENSDTKEKIFNEYNWGGYLIWHLRDELVFVDGRTDLFGDEILSDYIDVMTSQANWQKILHTYGVTTMVIKSDSRLNDLALMSGWNLEYGDGYANVLRQQK